MAGVDRVRYFETIKGKKGIAYGGYEYRFAKFVDNGVHKYWRCVNKNCNGSVKTAADDSGLVEYNQHFHVSNPEQTDVRVTVNAMRKRAATETGPLPKIFKEEASKVAGTPSVAAQLPTYQHVESSLHKRRRKNLPALPQSRADINIPNNLKTTVSGQLFLLHGSAGNEMLIFGTQGKYSFV